MKYDTSITELKNILPTAKNILIALPTNVSIDQLAAGLALFLTLQAVGKEVAVACEIEIKVSQSHLFGIDHVQKNISSTDGGNLTLTLEGVAASDGTVPALEKLDWSAENNNLNLVFHVLPGQTFQPARIVPKYQGSGFSLIFVVGSVNLNALGSVYSANQQAFNVHIVNVDTETANTSFGQTNIVDTQSSSVSEVMTNLISDLGLSLDADTASNLLAGIFESTNNLTDQRATADTFMAVANCLRVGGRKPASTSAGLGGPSSVASQVVQAQQPTQPAYDWSAIMPASPAGGPKNTNSSVSSIDMQQVNPQPQSPIIPDFMTPPVVSTAPSDDKGTAQAEQPSPEERPYEEGVISETVEPEWLTPKIFKGSSLG